MNSSGARIGLIGVGVVALVAGGVWIGQGLNLIPGSFMTGNRMWFDIGLLVVAVGVILVVFGIRRPKGRSRNR